jgi:hypothetical protein
MSMSRRKLIEQEPPMEGKASRGFGKPSDLGRIDIALRPAVDDAHSAVRQHGHVHEEIDVGDDVLFAQAVRGQRANDPVVTDIVIRQRRIFDVTKRREAIDDLQRYLAKQQYCVQLPSGIYVAVWDGALKNYGPNLGYDYGGRLMAAWLDR